jgi:hypothetical protein
MGLQKTWYGASSNRMHRRRLLEREDRAEYRE